MAQEKTLNVNDLFLQTEDNKAVSRQGDFIMGYRIHYVPQYSQGEMDFTGIKSTWDMALKNLPVKTVVVKSDMYLKREYDGTGMPRETFLQKSTSDYFTGRLYFEHTGTIYFI